MICPYCRAENPEDSASCTKCGAVFPAFDEGKTMDSAGPSPLSAIGGAPPAGGKSPPSAPSSSRSAAYSSGIFEAGAELGQRYRIEALIGQGGMGRVYRAYDRELDRVVALKVILPEFATDPNAMQRFKQELLLASKISHKSILRIHDLGEAEGVKFISMAYVEGQDLHQLLAEHGRLPVERGAKIATQLCEALDAAHNEGIVHRDLKPQNILIDKNDHVYISDFGLAKSLESSAAGVTRSGQFLGTPRYMSPEQVEAKPVDRRSDIYSLGLILYEMFTGETPFKGDSTLQVMYQRVKRKPKNPKLANPSLPDTLARIILRCLEKEPARRYQNAHEILADLQAERAPSRSVGTRSVQISLPVMERRGWIVTGTVVSALIAIALGVPRVRHFLFRRSPTGGAAVTQAGVPPLAQGKYVAVLPFKVLGNQSSLGYLADGLDEALSAKLFQLRGVRVASADAAGKADSSAPLLKIARGLGVNLIVQGMLQGVGDKIRIIVNLEDVPDTRRLWSQEFTGVTGDLFTLEDEIYTQLVAALELRPSNAEMARAAAHPTENMEAYDLYLHGRSALRHPQDPKNVEAAVGLFDQALKKDPDFALAYAGMADASLEMYHEKKDSFWSDKALAAAREAAQLDDKLPEIHFSLGSVYIATGKTAQAISELQRAVALSPNSDDGYRRLASAYLADGRNPEAIQAYQKAVDINPYFWVNYNAIGVAYLQLGENANALASFQKVTELEPDNAAGYENIGNAYYRQSRWNDCIPAYQKALQLQPYWSTYSNLGVAYFYLKRYTDAAQMFEKAVELNPNEEVAVGNLADAYRWSGQKEKAQAAYDKAIALAYKELEVNPRNAATMGSLALYYAKKGDSAQALDFIRRARAIDRSSVPLIYIEAMVQTLAGQQGKAVSTLRTALEKGYPVEEMKSDPELDSLRNRPDYEKLVREFSNKKS